MKKSIKQLLSAVLVIAMLASLLVVPAAAADGNAVAGIYYVSKYAHQGQQASDADVVADDAVPGVTFDAKFTDHNSSGHGPHCSAGGTMTVNVPSGKYSTLVVTVCGYSKGFGVTSSSGVVSAKALSGCNGAGSEVTIANATGTTTVTFESEAYVHGLTVGEITDTPASVEPAVEAEDEVVATEGKTTTLDVTLVNAEGKVATWTYTVDDDTVAGRLVSKEAGKVSFTGGKPGKAVVTLTAQVDGKDYSKDVTVYVKLADVGEVTDGEHVFSGDEGKLNFYITPGFAWTTIAHGGNGHGPTAKSGSVTVHIPEGKLADLDIVTCEWGAGGKITATSGEVGTGTKATEGEAVTTTPVIGAQGATTIAFDAEVYVHSIKVTLRDENAAAMSVSPTAVSMRAKESKDVTVTFSGYEADVKPFAMSGDAAVATVAVTDNKVTVTGVAEGETKVYVYMAKEALADLDAVKADPSVKEVAVTVTAPLAEGVKVWDFKVGGADDLTAAMEGLTTAQGTAGNPLRYHGSTYGIYFFPGNTIGVPVDGPSTITVYTGYTWNVGVGTAVNGEQYGALGMTSGDNGKDVEQVFTYTGGKGYAYVTALAGCTSYVAGIKVEPITGMTPNAVDVWDFSAEELDTALFTNKLTVEIMNSWYPADVVVGTSGNNFPAEGFDTGELVFNTDAKTNNRLRTDNEAITRHSSQTKLGAVGADPYASSEITLDAETGAVKGGEFYHGLIYSNSTGNANINMVLTAKAGDKITYISGSNGGAATYAFKDAEGNILGTGDYAPEGEVNAVPLTFYAPADGAYTYAIDNQEKLVVCRIYREAGVKTTVTGNVDQSMAAGLTGEYSVVFTGPGGVQTKAPVQNGKYTIELNNYLTGADYVVSLEGADGYIVASGEEFSIESTDRTGAHDIVVASVDLVTVTGKVAGLAEADLANLVLTITKPEDKIYQPKIVPAEDGSFTASFEKNVEYALTASNVNDYELVKDKLTFTADKAENVVFVPKTTYAVTVVPTPADVDLTNATFTFTNKDDVDAAHEGGYTYTFNGPEGIKLRDGQYTVEVKGASGIQKLTPDLLVAGADTQCPISFLNETPTSWVFTKDAFTADVLAAKDFNQLKLDGDVRREEKDHAILGATGKLSVPVDGPCKVNVTVYYAAEGTIGAGTDTVEMKTDASTGTTSASDTITYNYTGATAGYVDVIATATSYILKIEVVKTIPYAATVTVGADKQFKTINEALAAVKTMERTAEQRVTIEIDPGDYEEMLRIDVPNITLKNASATPSIALTNKGVDIDANAVRITSYYGHGYAYYSMDKDCTYNEELLAVNKANGKLSFENPGTGTTSGSYWNATVRVMASGIQAEGIIFENSFNQYVSKKAANDVIIPLQGAKEGAVPRAEMKAGDTTVQNKKYVERAAALAINDNCTEIFFDNCRFVGRQDTLYGGKNSTVGFYDCAVMGGTDYIFGPMIAVFAKCDLVFNTMEDQNDVGYITAPQQSSGRGYLMYNCHITSTTPGVDTASTTVSKPGTFGRPWAANTGEAVFYATDIDATDPIYYTTDTAKGTSMIQGIGWFDTLSGKSAVCGDYGTVEYYEGADTTADRASWAAKFTEAKTADGASMTDTTAWLGGWNAFDGKDMTIQNQTPKAFSVDVLKEELKEAIEAANATLAAAPEEKADDVAAADVDRGTQFVHAGDKTAFQTAIAAAQTVVDNASASQADVLAAQKALATAVKAFNAAVQNGAKAPNTADLEAALATAATAKAGVVVTAGPASEVTKDVSFAPKTAFDALNAAIQAAKDVAKGVASTQKDVDDAKAALEAAITAFNAAKGVGTKAADAASLKAAIDAAKAAKEGVVVNAGPADQVEPDVKFVTDQAVIDTLDAAIAAAQTVADKADATQSELDAALKALIIATTDFEASVLTGTKGGEVPGVDKADLTKAVEAAEGVYAIGDDVKVLPKGTKASTVEKGQKFVTQDVYDALAKAIADAKAVIDNKDATEEDVTKALADLKAAQDAFKVLTGTKGSGGSGGSSSRPGNRPGNTEQPTNLPFTDVKADDWFYSSVKKAFDKGLMKGTGESTFAPTAKTTRAMVATILYRLAGENKTDVANLFNDVAADTWYTDAVAWAAEQGIIKGYNDTTFGPENNVTREQLVVMLYRYANATVKEGRDLSAFHDAADVSEWAVEAMTWAVDKGIILGRGNGQLDPTGLASRAEVCTVLVRFLEMK